MKSQAGHHKWSRQKWISLILLSFLAHLLLIFLAGEHSSASRGGSKAFQVQLSETVASTAAKQPEYEDPALFALPNEHGFSGNAWIRLPIHTNDYHEWADEIRWLPMPTNELGAVFEAYAQSLVARPAAMAEKPRPQVRAPSVEPAPEWSPSKSTLQISGSLASRKILNPPALQSWPHTDVLAPSRVQVLVNDQGYVFSLALIAESGLRPADEKALEITRRLVFEDCKSDPKTNAGRLENGVMVFYWHTQPATNQVNKTFR